MPHIQGYIYESYTCEDCGSNLWWPGSACPECNGEVNVASFQTLPERVGPPVKPQAWQIESLNWDKQDREERTRRQWVRDTAARERRALYAHYRLQCIPYKLLALIAPAEYVDKALRVALSSKYELIIREVLETPQGEMAAAIISCEKVYRPNWYRMFDSGWRPAKPLSKDSSFQDAEPSKPE